MKRSFFFFATILAFLAHSTVLNAQEALTEGSLVFEITSIKTDNPNLKQSMQGSTNEVHFKGTVYKNDVQMMNGAVHLQRLKNDATNEFSVYLDLMGKQMKVSVPDSVQKTKQKESEESTNIIYDESTTKIIEGYKCYKATVETLKADGSVKEFHLYITEAIKIPASAIGGLPKVLKGFPLEYSTKVGETELFYTLKSFNKTLTVDALKTPDTYPSMDYKEFEAGIGKKIGL